MKTMRKVTALILTMVLCVALGVPAFAADSSSESDVTTKTYTFGNIIVTVVKAPNEITPMPLGSDYIEDALASPPLALLVYACADRPIPKTGQGKVPGRIILNIIDHANSMPIFLFNSFIITISPFLLFILLYHILSYFSISYWCVCYRLYSKFGVKGW